MNIMTVEHLSKSYGEKVLFSDASFGMDDRDKIGLIGVNGTGKSTFYGLLPVWILRMVDKLPSGIM